MKSKPSQTNLTQILKNFRISPTTLNAVLGVIVVMGGSYGGYNVYKNGQENLENPKFYQMQEVVDGDTFKLTDGNTVRLSNIDAPESKQCFAEESKNKLEAILQGRKLRLEKDITGIDPFGRLVRHVIAINENEKENNINVNKYLIENGFAKYSETNDIFLSKDFQKHENAARKNKLGMWAACEKEITKQEKESSESGKFGQTNNQPTNSKCIIKGNISENDSGKIYLLPTCANYTETKIDFSKGEKYFCTEAEAKKNGFSKAFMCL